MTRGTADLAPDLVQLIMDHADSVPHLEALQLLWDTVPRAWSEAQLAARLYVSEAAARTIVRDLERKGLITAQTDGYALTEDVAARAVARRIVEAYRGNLAAVASLIHSQPSASVREFARAFRLKGDHKP